MVQQYDISLLQLPFPWAIGNSACYLIFPTCSERSWVPHGLGELTVKAGLRERPGNLMDSDIGHLVCESTGKCKGLGI